MLVELSKLEQHYGAVLGVIRDGYSVKEVAEAYGVSRQSVHAWLARYEKGGLPALANQSHKPKHSYFHPYCALAPLSGPLVTRPVASSNGR